MSSWLYLVIGLVSLVLSAVARYWLFPLIIAELTQFRVSSFSLLNARGLEWREKGRLGEVVPTLRIERSRWAWGGAKEEGIGLIVLKMEGLSYRVRKVQRDEPLAPKARQVKPASRLSRYKNRLLSQLLHLFIHHYPSLAQLVSIQISDIRIIFDEIHGLEFTQKEFRLGVRVEFERDADPSELPPPPNPASPSPPSSDFKRGHPFASPSMIGMPLSPPGSPLASPGSSQTAFAPFTWSDSLTTPDLRPPDSGRPRLSRIAHARRKASVFQSRVSSTAGTILSRALARAHGSVTCFVTLDESVVILPHFYVSDPMSSRPCIPDLIPRPHPQAHGVSNRQSEKSLQFSGPSSDQPKSFVSVGSLNSILAPRLPRFALPNAEGGYERLLVIDGVSYLAVGLGFGPKKGLLGEDTLKISLSLASLHTSMGSVEKVQDLLKIHEDDLSRSPPGRTKSPWAPDAMPRIVLRALTSVSMSFQDFTISHYLATSGSKPVSASSSVTDMSDASAASDQVFTLAANVSTFSCKVSAADSSNNQRARNAFGTNGSSASKVRGIGYELRWSSVTIQCQAPGETNHETSQLFQMRSAEVEGMSTWRPVGWTREKLLFATDPNLALIVQQGSIASIDVAADVQLLDELRQAWDRNKSTALPVKKATVSDDSRGISLLPRIRMVLDIGPAMFTLADRLSQYKTTMTLASDGLHLGCFTSYSTVSGRRRDRNVTRTAFKQEEELYQRREEAEELGVDLDYAQPDTMLKPSLRRQFAASATLPEDYAISMRGDASIVLEPMALHLSLSGQKSKNQESYNLATIGRAHASCDWNLLGRANIEPDGSESMILDPKTVIGNVDLGFDRGIQIQLWEMAVIDALIAIRHAHPQPRESGTSAPGPSSLMQLLPSGISARLSLGLISVFVGHEDPNPDCKLKLNRGLWLQTAATIEYAYYDVHAQAMQCKPTSTSATRARLRLPEDITTQALAFQTALASGQGRAALSSITLIDVFVVPIFNGRRFTDKGGTSLVYRSPPAPAARKAEDAHLGWEFRSPHAKDDLPDGELANNINPFEVSDTDQAQRPLLRFNRASLNWLIQCTDPDAELEHRATGKVGRVDAVCDMSHLYCGLLAGLTVRRVVTARKKSLASVMTKRRINIILQLSIPIVFAHFAFPLGEQLHITLSGLSFSYPADQKLCCLFDTFQARVPSPRQTGRWEEIVLLKKVSVSRPRDEESFDLEAGAIRVRIPVAYKLSKLVLNVNVTIKSLRLLLANLDGQAFSYVKKPEGERPKRVPKVSFSIANLSFEAIDSPLETQLNLIYRAGMAEQEVRAALYDMYDRKLAMLEEREQNGPQEKLHYDENGNGRKSTIPRLTEKATLTDFDEAKTKLDLHVSRSWSQRIRSAVEEQQRREAEASKQFGLPNPSIKVPVPSVKASRTPPLFRLSMSGLKLSIQDLGWTREEIINYMGDVSIPFGEGAEFSLMVPFKLFWSFEEARGTLRDYPLPLVRIPPAKSGGPAWKVETPFIIAEEMADDDSLVLVSSEVVLAGCGGTDARALTLQIAKTIMPVKTYSRPMVEVTTERTTEFTWGNSYQPAIQDLMKVMETLSHPPRDMSPRVGFWDKFRLTLHWMVQIKFVGTVHLHLKGTYDPYALTGRGAGFALAWREGTTFNINQPNEQFETIQISSDELLITIPDLTSLQDRAAIGSQASQLGSDSLVTPASQDLLERRYTKPCARFNNGVRVGFGFRFEATCRMHNCKENCGKGENLFRRQCRRFAFKRHQDVVLKSAAASARQADLIGRPVDSYEGFRSDYIHFSVSVVTPLNGVVDSDTAKANALHFSPKATAHFLNWWNLFDHTMSLPIRQGRLFPDSPPPSKKFGRSLATIKFRLDVAPVYVSHMYQQVSGGLWQMGQSQAVGLKARARQFKLDAHMRAQEKLVRNKDLKRTKVVLHKSLYAVDLSLDDIRVKGVRANFSEQGTLAAHKRLASTLPMASELPDALKEWYNFFDFIDADKKPFDRNPELEIVDLCDVPQVSWSKRVKARMNTPHDDQKNGYSKEADTGAEDKLERSKFGHEYSHICMLGEPKAVGPMQIGLAKDRIRELQMRHVELAGQISERESRDIDNRLNTLRRHLEELAEKEDRYIDDDTLQPAVGGHPLDGPEDDKAFQDTYHLHCPRIYWNNSSRNILLKYYYSNRDRMKEEYLTSHASLRGVLEKIDKHQRRTQEAKYPMTMAGAEEGNQEPTPIRIEEYSATDLLQELQAVFFQHNIGSKFRLPNDFSVDSVDSTDPSLGLAKKCEPKPHQLFLLLRPQIALRSEVGDDAVVLLASEEIFMKSFQVIDTTAVDNVAGRVLDRYYAGMKALHAYYPTAETIARHRSGIGVPRGLDFIPLEILVDKGSRSTDYDRIVAHTDAAITMDAFTDLSVPRELSWPQTFNEEGEEITHLRAYQNLTTVVVPRLNVTATSKHYTALYNVVTDLLIYSDPDHSRRSERIENFTLAFDQKDRNPPKLLMDLSHLQQSIRNLSVLQQGYEANVDLLNDEGKRELFKIRTDLLEATEQIFTVFEAISTTKLRDKARAAEKTASRTDVRVGGIAWVMLQDDVRPFVKLDIEGTLYAWNSNKDGSHDSAIVFGDLSALNCNPDALYPEIMVRHEGSGSRGKIMKEPFASACWSILAPVGGINIVRQLHFYPHPIRVKLEEQVGHLMVDYIFNDRVKRRKQKAIMKTAHGTSTPRMPETTSNGTGLGSGTGKRLAKSRIPSGMEMPPLARSGSAASVASMTTIGTTISELGKADDQFTMVPTRDAAEMRRRAASSKHFVSIVFGASTFVLSFKSDDSKRHKLLSTPDCVEFMLKIPLMHYVNKIWGYEDVFEQVKRDMRSSLWKQTGDLLQQVVSKTSMFRSRKNLKHVPVLSAGPVHRPSALRNPVEPMTPSDDPIDAALLARALSKEARGMRRRSDSRSAESGPQIMGVPLNGTDRGLSENEEADGGVMERSMTEGKDGRGDKDDVTAGVGRAVKGLLGKLKNRSLKGHSSTLSSHSTDDLSLVSNGKAQTSTPGSSMSSRSKEYGTHVYL